MSISLIVNIKYYVIVKIKKENNFINSVLSIHGIMNQSCVNVHNVKTIETYINAHLMKTIKEITIQQV